jgi:hypothetical protein
MGGILKIMMNPEEHHHYRHRRENLKSQIMFGDNLE